MSAVAKVTAFITRERPSGRQLLLFQHPTAGVQLPAGTVEPGEDVETAVLREAFEETGLAGLTIKRYLGRFEHVETAVLRDLFWLLPTEPTPERWQVATDGHIFSLFWAPLHPMPQLVAGQDLWLEAVYVQLR